MHWKRFCLVSLSLAWMAFPARVRAQEATSVPGYASVEDFSGAMTLGSGGGTYLLFNKQTGKAVGTPNGYSRIGIRHTLYENGPDQFFAEAHGLITDSERYGMNVGGGYRYLMDNALYGVNGWYDQIESQQGHGYQQGGVGLEYLSQPLDLRANGYMPFGERENFLNVVDPGTTPVFQGHNYSTLGTALFQQALAGFDAEAGIPVPVVNWLRMYSGFYYLQFDGDKTWGVRARAEGKITQGVNLSFQVSDDNMFGTNLNVGIDVQFDGRLPTRFGGDTSTFGRRYDQVRRQWQVQLAHREGDYAVPLNDPADGNPILVSWIDNTVGAGGDGTIENPYNVLPGDVDSDYVLVRQGVGNTVGNINLRPGQDLFGEGKQHYINTDRLGLSAIPDTFFANSGGRPMLQAGDLSRPIVTLNDNSTVRSFEMFGGNGAAIGGSSVDNFLVECVDVTSGSGLVASAGGHSTVRDSNFINTNPTGVGIHVANSGGLDLLIDGVTTQGGAIGTRVTSTSTPGVVNLVDYQGSDHTNVGVLLESTSTSLGVNIANAALTNVGDGFRVDVINGNLSGSMTDISATGSGNLFEANGNIGTLNLAVTNATLSNSTGGSGVSLNLTDTVGVATFDNLTANGNAVDGAQITGIGATTDYRLEIIDSNLVGNADDAVDSTALAGANVVVFVDPTNAINSGDNGYEFEADGAGSHVTGIMADTDYSNSGQDGVNGTVTNGARADLVFDRSPAANSGRNGLNVIVDNGSTFVGVFRDGTFSQSGIGNNGVGVNVSVTDSSIGRLTFEDTLSDSNGAVGLQYNVAGDSDLTMSFTNGNLSNNPVNNSIGTVDGANSRAIIDFTGTNQNFLAANGSFVSNVTNGASLFASWTNSNVAGGDGDGVRVTGSGANTEIDLAFNQSLIENNDGNGILASLTSSPLGSLSIDLDTSTVIGNGLDGVNLAVDGAGATGVLNVVGTPITNNARDGIEIDVTGGASVAATITGTGNNLSNNGENGLDVRSSGAASQATVSVSDINIDQSGATGVLLVAELAGQLDLNLSNLSISDNGTHGIESVAATNGQLSINADSATVIGNQRNGWTFDAITGGDVNGTWTNSTLGLNGIGAPSSGVRGIANGAGSTVDVDFNTVTSDENTLHGFQLNAVSGGNLLATLTDISANTNTGDGIQLTGLGAGTRSNLLMFGDSTLDGNQNNGLTVSGVDAEQIAVQLAGSVNNNLGDGINVFLQNVNNGALELTHAINGSISGNGGDGIEIDLIDTQLSDQTIDGTLVEALRIENLTIENNGGVGIDINASNSDLTAGSINNNLIRQNAGGGLLLNLTNGSDWNLDVTNNSILDNTGTGLQITSDSGTHTLNITDNTIAGSSIDNVNVALSGTSSTELHIDRNTVDGDGILATVTPVILQNVISPTSDALIVGQPPSVAAAVGPDHIVELMNDNFRIYDKSTGALLIDVSDEQFWSGTAGAILGASNVSSSRLLFDPTTNRWIATTLTNGLGNQIILAVSDTSDPTGTWQSVQFVGDTTGLRTSTFDTLGMDADTVVISTSEVGFGNSSSVFSIPKTDLFGLSPSVSRMTRVQNLSLLSVGSVLQAAVDSGPSDGQTAILSVDSFFGNQLFRTDIQNGDTAAAFLTAPTPIPVANMLIPSNVALPGGSNLQLNGTQFWGSTVEANGELWAVQHAQGGSGRNEIRWYRINESTNAIIAQGTISDPALSLFYPSVAVNDAGEVLISYHGASATTAPSAFATAGVVQGGSVLFGSPTLLTAGTGEYGGNRWGHYSSTVVDPSDTSQFWSILEVGAGTTDAVQDFEFTEAINAIDVQLVQGSANTTPGSGIVVSLNDTATLRTGSSINDNTVAGHGTDGIAVSLNDLTTVESLSVDGNTVFDNAGNGVTVALQGVLGTPDISVDNNTVTDNGGWGVAVDSVDTSFGILSTEGNTIQNSTGGDGLRVNLQSTDGTHVADRILASNNTITNNAGDGLAVSLLDLNITTDVVASNNTVSNNTGRGIVVDVLDTDLNDVVASFNTISGNTGGAGLSVLLNNTTFGPMVADQIVLSDNVVSNNAGTGVDVVLNNITGLAEVTVANSQITGNTGAGYSLVSNGSTVGNVSVTDTAIGSNSGGDGVLLDLTDTTITNLIQLQNNAISNNTGNGVNLDAENTAIGSLSIADNEQTLGLGVNGISSNGLDGIRISAASGSSIGLMAVDNNLVNNNGNTGLNLLIQDSTLPALADRISVSSNNISGNGSTGISLILPDTNGNSFGVNFVDNLITNHAGGRGIDIQLNDDAGTNFEASFVGNTVSNNGAEGINLALSENISATIDDFSGSTVSNNASVGLRVDATDNAQISLTMGTTGHNTFNANVDAGLAFTMNANTQGQLIALDSEFNNTRNGADATLNGEGISIHLDDNAILPNLVIGDPLAGTSGASGNASHGVAIIADIFSQLTNPTIQNMTLDNNGGDGLNIERRALAVLDNVLIEANSISGNAGDGIDLAARVGDLIDEYTLNNNVIDGNNGNGIAFLVQADADMTTILSGNTVTDNQGTGILVSSSIVLPTDTATFSGTWLASTIRGNNAGGIDINSPNHTIQIGDATGIVPDTIISENGQEGVLIRSTGVVDMDNVQINDNEADGVLFQGGLNGALTIDQAEISGNGGDGVQLDMTGNTLSVTNATITDNTNSGLNVRSLSGVNNVTLTNNVVNQNRQDGLLITNDSAAGLTAVVSNSQFSRNVERGVAIFNRGNGAANVTFEDNTLVANAEEGVYVVNTADADQNVRAASTLPMENGGLVTATPDLIFAMNRNTLTANGTTSGLTAGGFVMRVGTADGGSADFTDAGGFAATRAGVTAAMNDNIFQANSGSDVFFQSFVSTVDPLASVGVWNAATFSLATYATDPLARLDLVYGNNVADSTEATTIGAAYTNDEAIFKSRTIGQTPAGPFAAQDRQRNAQRLADRDVAPGGLLLNPNAPQIAPTYLFPGVGESTFRVRLDGGNVFGTGSGFILDGAPFFDVNDYNGVGSLPELFGWGTLP